MYAAECHDPRMAELLIAGGADLAAKDIGGCGQNATGRAPVPVSAVSRLCAGKRR